MIIMKRKKVNINMSTMERTVSMCLTKVLDTNISLAANNVPINDQSTGADSVVTNHSIPHSQTWALSQEANKRSGMCIVCFATWQIHVKDGTIHKHGPRNNPCTGSGQLPVPDSVQPQQSRQPLQSSGMFAITSKSDCQLSGSSYSHRTEPFHATQRHSTSDTRQANT